MMTYSLKENNTRSDTYYFEINQFANKTKLHIYNEMGSTVAEFLNFIKERQYEEPRTLDEYTIEILMLSVLGLVYQERALGLNSSIQKMLTYIVNQREKGKLQKKISDFIKGKLATMVLARNVRVKEKNMNALQQLKKLIAWLEASGDFKHETTRLLVWIAFLESKKVTQAELIIHRLERIGKWFEKESEQAIGKYTLSVNEYLMQSYNLHKWKENIIFCSRKRVEYHLNMVGAEIMNNALRTTFLKQKTKIVFLPRCMCKNNEQKCRAVYRSRGYACKHCEATCSVNSLTNLGKKYNFEVYVIPHESDFHYEKSEDNRQIGIVGIACVLNLLQGGYKAKTMGFIPQCIVLDYCGCKKHWHQYGITTEINDLRLKQVLGISES